MKKDLETITTSLYGETIYLQIPDDFLESRHDRSRWKRCAHYHQAYEVHLLVQGGCQVNMEGQTIPLNEGQAVLIAPGQYHEFFAPDGEFERFSFFFMPGNNAQGMCAVLREKVKGFQIFDATEEMLQTGRKMPQDWERKAPFRQEKRKAQLINMFIDICWELGLVIEEPWDVSMGLSRLLLCDDFFADTAGRSARHLADILQISERQLNRCLMEFYGMNFQQKMVQSRMERAAWLLRTTDKSVSQIAEEVGYEAENGLYKGFRKAYGMPPQQYRKQHENRS